jgi:putative transposase
MYPTDLTDSGWQVMEEVLNDQRKRRYSLRSILNAIFYVTRTGCQWRLLPNDMPPWQLCYYYFWKWRNNGTWQRLNKILVERQRLVFSRAPSPSVGIIDSQSVKSSEWAGRRRGYSSKRV